VFATPLKPPRNAPPLRGAALLYVTLAQRDPCWPGRSLLHRVIANYFFWSSPIRTRLFACAARFVTPSSPWCASGRAGGSVCAFRAQPRRGASRSAMLRPGLG